MAARAPVQPPALTAIALEPHWHGQPGRRASFIRDIEMFAKACGTLGPRAAVLLRAHGWTPAQWSAALDALGSLPLGAARLGVTAPVAEPHADAGELARSLCDLARRGIAFLQVPEHGGSAAVWRAALDRAGLGLGLGRSCHDAAGIAAALTTGADWAWISPVFATPSKPGGAPLGLETLGALARAWPGRVVALGGIEPESVSAVRACGVAGIACVRAAWDVRCAALTAAWADPST